MINIIVGNRIFGNKEGNNYGKNIENIIQEDPNLRNENNIKTVYPKDVDPYYHVYSLYSKGCSKKDIRYLEETIEMINYYLKNKNLDEEKIKKIKKVEYKTILALEYFNTQNIKNYERRKQSVKKELITKYNLSDNEIFYLEKEVKDYFNQKPVIYYRNLVFN